LPALDILRTRGEVEIFTYLPIQDIAVHFTARSSLGGIIQLIFKISFSSDPIAILPPAQSASSIKFNKRLDLRDLIPERPVSPTDP